MTSGAVCSFFWSVALVALLLVGLSSLCVYQVCLMCPHLCLICPHLCLMCPMCCLTCLVCFLCLVCFMCFLCLVAVQMGNLPTYVDDNFDAGGKIRENMGYARGML